MQADPLTLVSLGIGFGAVVLGLWQTALTRRALHAQAYIGLEAIEKSSRLRDGIQALASLPKYSTYDSYVAGEPEETQQLIYDAVGYLNFIAHLVDEGFLSRRRAWGLYLYTYALVDEKLLP